MPYWHAVLLGVVQGLTEFLPISSTAHLLLVQEWLGRTRDQLKDDPFTVVIQLGTLVAVVAYFRRDIVKLIRAFCFDLYENRIFTSTTPEGWMVKWIIVGTVPVAVLGLLFKKWLKTTFYNPQAIAIVAIVFALLMLLAELYAARRRRRGLPDRDEAKITLADAIFIGCFQALALMPGGSRSGTTLTAGLFAGFSRTAAARFSFLLSLPSIFAAGFKDLYDWYKDVKADPALAAQANEQAVAMLIGTAVAAVVGYFSIAILMHFLKRYSMMVFVVYRIVLGLAILGMIAAGWIAK